MVQEEIIELLESNDKIYSSKEIAEELKQDLTKIRHAIPRLIKYEEISYIELDRVQASICSKQPRLTRRMKFFFRVGLDYKRILKERVKTEKN